MIVKEAFPLIDRLNNALTLSNPVLILKTTVQLSCPLTILFLLERKLASS